MGIVDISENDSPKPCLRPRDSQVNEKHDQRERFQLGCSLVASTLPCLERQKVHMQKWQDLKILCDKL